MNIHTILLEKIQQALVAAGAPTNCKAQVRQSVKTLFGNYQVNGIMSIAKQLGLPPYQLAKKVVNLLNLNGIANKIDIAGPGYINIFLAPSWLEIQLSKALSSSRLGITRVKPQITVVDYSAPNVAKEMHVGHVRSTIIGDASVRILSFLGHHVIRANHIGDWGTQFGMLIAYLEKIQYNNQTELQISNLDKFYLAAKKYYDNNLTFAKRARSYVKKLQNGDEYCLTMWHKLVDITMVENQKIYDLLNVTLTHADIMGESLYNNMLPDIIADLKTKGIAVKSAGATVVFLNEFKNKEGTPMGVIIQKKDGAYLYTTTDIACAKYRYEKLNADRIIYYVDSRQHQHLMQVWSIVRKAKYIPQSVKLEHHMFGMILGKDGKPFKTRAGSTIKLTHLLDEAQKRARCIISNKNATIGTNELKKIAHVIGIGAIKYADLSKNRTTNYIFDWDSMISFEGNTAPYIQYAYTRIISLLKRNNLENKQHFTGKIQLKSTQETQLAVRLLQLEEAIIAVAHNGTPHILCAYLYDIAVLFSNFYEHYPILNAENLVLRHSRLQLAKLTALTLKQGLELLGIETVERM